MKKLLNTLYISNPLYYLSLDGENIVVKQENETVARLPLHNLQNIVTFSYVGASPMLMKACVERNIDLCFMTHSGRFGARVTGEVYGNVLLRKTQYRYSDDKNKSLEIAKNFITGKLYNSYSTISRTIRDHGIRVNTKYLDEAKIKLRASMGRIIDCKNNEELMGIEGEAAQTYFSVFDDMIINQKDKFRFLSRSRRPPLDNVNAMLSLLYSLLTNDCAAALQGVGLDPYVGFLHRDRPGRVSLALDLMEELRSVFVDRMVLTLINRGQVSNKDFVKKDNGAVVLEDSARKTILNEWQNKKKTQITHPYLKEKLEWGIVPHVQAMLLARYIRGDIDEYPAFFWK